MTATTPTIDHPRLSLHGDGPTPVRRLDENLWLKDDGRFGDGGWGGNKVRKLEWLLGRAQQDGVERILTFGGSGTNWGLATALYARTIGIDTVLALVDQPLTPHVEEQFDRIRRSGARVVLNAQAQGGRQPWLPWLWLRNGRPWMLPAGGSTPLGAVGYVAAGLEIGRAGAARRAARARPDRDCRRHGRHARRPRRRTAGSQDCARGRTA